MDHSSNGVTTPSDSSSARDVHLPYRSLTFDHTSEPTGERASFSLDITDKTEIDNSQLSKRGIIVTDIDQAMLDHDTRILAQMNTISAQKGIDVMAVAPRATGMPLLPPEPMTNNKRHSMQDANNAIASAKLLSSANNGPESGTDNEYVKQMNNTVQSSLNSNYSAFKVDKLHWPTEVPTKLNFSHLEIFEGRF